MHQRCFSVTSAKKQPPLPHSSSAARSRWSIGGKSHCKADSDEALGLGLVDLEEGGALGEAGEGLAPQALDGPQQVEGVQLALPRLRGACTRTNTPFPFL